MTDIEQMKLKLLGEMTVDTRQHCTCLFIHQCPVTNKHSCLETEMDNG